MCCVNTEYVLCCVSVHERLRVMLYEYHYYYTEIRLILLPHDNLWLIHSQAILPSLLTPPMALAFIRYEVHNSWALLQKAYDAGSQ